MRSYPPRDLSEHDHEVGIDPVTEGQKKKKKKQDVFFKKELFPVYLKKFCFDIIENQSTLGFLYLTVVPI